MAGRHASTSRGGPVDISKPRRRPKLAWRLHVGGTIESTPAVWHGCIYVGSRDGGIYGIPNPHTK